MTANNGQTIVKNLVALRFYPRRYIDEPTIGLIYRSIPVASTKSDLRNPLINLLDCYLGLTGQSLTYLSLSKNTSITTLHGFIGAIISPNFTDASEITKDIYRRTFETTLRLMALEVPNLDFKVNNKLALQLWQQMKIDSLQHEYYQAWLAYGKNGESAGNLRLAWIWNTLGPDQARTLHLAASRFSERYEAESKGNFLPIFNDLIDYLERSHANLGEVDMINPDFTTKVIEGFCRDFFERKVEAKNCLETTIKRWNDALPFLESTLLDSGFFARPYRKFPYVEPSRKIGAETKISTNEDGVLVKDKLIVDVPLTLTDDEVIKILFQEINSAVDVVLQWATSQANSIYERCEGEGSRFDFIDFDLNSKHIRSKYRIGKAYQTKTSEIAYRLGLPTSHSLEPFMFLLIKEHPLITESFLTGLKLFDKYGKIVGLEKTDSCTYLIGYKRRKGGKKALQRVCLNERSIVFVEQVIKITQPLRDYLKAKNDDNYRYLFLSCRLGFSYPTPVSNLLSEREPTAFSARVNQFEGVVGYSSNQTTAQLVKNLSPTKFRATVGLQIYLETSSAKAMSEALGHVKYKPELLSHYLPEPILAFFQSRWIRIFQKGIVCESMKDSPLLLRASNFDSMEELHKFLTSHLFSLPSDPSDSAKNRKDLADKIYISVDENVLTGLLSLKSAVQLTESRLVSDKAHYWSKFASLLESEIENNTYDSEMTEALKVARGKADHNLMKKFVLAEIV